MISESQETEKSVSVLVVDSHSAELAATAAILEGGGYQVSRALGFEEGRRSLDSVQPAVLITSVRLGSFNGLHLIVRSRVSCPSMTAILMHDFSDPVLEREARMQDAIFLSRPWDPQTLLNLVAESVASSAKADQAKNTAKANAWSDESRRQVRL